MMNQESHAWIFDNVTDALHAISGAAFWLVVDGRIDGVTVVDKAYRDKMGRSKAIRGSQMANAVRLYHSCQVILRHAHIVTHSSLPVKDKTELLDARALACYNYPCQRKGDMYGR